MRKRTSIPMLTGHRTTAMRLVVVVGAVALSAVQACQLADRPERRPVSHPTTRNAPPQDAVAMSSDTVPDGLAGDALASWTRMRQDLLGAQTVLRLGSQDHPSHGVFGNVLHAEADREGNLLVLDSQSKVLTAFDLRGRFLSTVGGFGEGPLELRYASGHFDVLEDGRILVPNGPHIKILARNAAGWTLERMVDVPRTAEAVCAFEGRDTAFSVGWNLEDNTLVHPFSVETGARRSSFGIGYVDDSQLVQRVMARGTRGVCLDGEVPRVAAAFGLLPIVRLYSLPEGEVVWTSHLVDHVPAGVTSQIRWIDDVGGERLSVNLDTDSDSDYLVAIVAMSRDHILAQYARRSTGIRSYLIDAASGAGAYIGDSLPIVASVYSDGYVAIVNDPYPRLELRRLGGQLQSDQTR